MEETIRISDENEGLTKDLLAFTTGKAPDSAGLSDGIEYVSRATSSEGGSYDEEVYSSPVRSQDAKTEERKDKKGSSLVRFNINDDVVLEDIQMVDPRLLIVLGHFMIFAEKNNLPVNVTSMINDRENVQAVSRTHEEGRALDISSKGWPEHKIQEVTEQMLHIANHYGAISYSDNERRVIIHHEYKGQGDHFHLQVAR